MEILRPKSMFRSLSISICLFSMFHAYGQRDEIVLNNPSFEERPHKGVSAHDIGIRGWYDCGELIFPAESPPDIHPINAWYVTKNPSEGISYLGMVVRDNDSWESVSQRIRVPIQEGKCYSYSIELARSRYYISGSKLSGTMENYTEPAVLRIWGGTGICGRQELLAESPTITNHEWETYEFEFQPGRSLNYFTLEAFYKVPVLFPYNGHLLLDNGSVIKEIPCDDEPLFASVEKLPPIPDEPEPAPVKKSVTVKETAAASSTGSTPVMEEPEPEKKPSRLVAGLDAKTIREGQVIRVDNIYFAADSSRIRDESEEVLDEIYTFLRDNKNIVVEIGGHTSTMPSHEYCDNLSSNRAREVAQALMRKGISPKRLTYKGYGKRKPLIRNDKFDMAARKKNQRVEIKILSISYSDTE